MDHHPEPTSGEASFGGIALDALRIAREAQGEIESHEKICVERYTNINDKLGLLFKIIAWAGGSAFMIVMGLLGFLAKTQFDQIKAMQEASSQRAAIIERVQPQPPQVIIQRAPGQADMGATVEPRPIH